VEEDISCYIDDIIQNRVRTGQNGACWQRAFIAAHGSDFQNMTQAYFENQNNNLPVHEWEV